MWLLIDDERDLNCDAIARNAKAGKKLLTSGGWDVVCFDHDLGHGETGYDVLMFAIDLNLLSTVSKIQLVTANPVGRAKMATALIMDGWTKVSPVEFIQEV